MAHASPPQSHGIRSNPTDTKVFLVGGGIASLAAAVFLIRDGDIPGCNVTIFDELDTIGGSLDGSGSAETGYVLRGGRMLESKYLCTFDLFSSIPTLDDSRTVTEETFAWNETMKTSSKSRLMRDGIRQTAPRFGLSEAHILTIERLALEPEGMLGSTTISDQFNSAFFKTDFWFMWCTTFAFQPWHSAVEFKRYLVRFAHMVDGFDRLKGIMRTVYNQNESMVRPLRKWLTARGVRVELNTRITDLRFHEQNGIERVTGFVFDSAEKDGQMMVGPDDLVLLTLGSMTEASTLGTMDKAPELLGKNDGGAWTLWETLAAGRPEFGHPEAFADHIAQSKWISFTATMHENRQRSDRQRPGGRRPDHFSGLRMAGLDRHSAPAAFHRSARRCQRPLGLWTVGRQAGRFRQEADVHL
jgi:oleate hydratase